MSEEQHNLAELKEEMEELITLLAQTSDSTAINLASRFEKFEGELEKRDSKRWSSSKWIVGIALTIFSISMSIGYNAADKMYTSINENTKQIALLTAENKDQVSRHELINAIEKRFSIIETSMKDTVTVKDLEKLKTELIQFVIRYHANGGKS